MSALVALITRTFVVRVLLEPSRSNWPLSSTRNKLRLPGERQVADLVEEQRAAVGELEAAFARAIRRAGVRAGFGAEKLGLDQLGRQRAAVDGDERAVLDRRVRLDDLGDAFLAGAVRRP